MGMVTRGAVAGAALLTVFLLLATMQQKQEETALMQVQKQQSEMRLHAVVKRAAAASAKARTQALLSTSDFPYTLDKAAGVRAARQSPVDGISLSDHAAMDLASKMASQTILPGDVADRAAGQMAILAAAVAPSTHPKAFVAPVITPQLATASDPMSQLTTAAGGPEEIKAGDSPIGMVDAAKILGDAEGLEKSRGPTGALDEWKNAVKGSAAKAMEDITDDVTAGNPFPHQSMAEKMEIEDVWKKAQAMARPAGKLDGDAADNQKAIDNAVAQASASAYMAANEAAAVDSYDLSTPNPDMMANKPKAAGLPGQAAANTAHASSAMAGRAAAVAGRKPALRMPRVQVLAEVEGKEEGIQERALEDARKQASRVRALRRKYYEALGMQKEAMRLAKSAGEDAAPAAPADVEGNAAVVPEVAAVAAAPRTSAAGRMPAPDAPENVEPVLDEAKRELQQSVKREGALARQLEEAKREDAAVHAQRGRGGSVGLREEARRLRAKLAKAEDVLEGRGGVIQDTIESGGITGEMREVLGDRREAQDSASWGPVAKGEKVMRVGGNPLANPFGA